MSKFKLSRYLITVEVDENLNDLFSKLIIFSTRTGRSLIVTKGAYELLANKHFDPIPTKVLIRLIGAEILVPNNQDELQTIRDRINKIDEIGLLVNKDLSTSNTLKKNVISTISGLLKTTKLKRINILLNLNKSGYIKSSFFIEELNKIGKCSIDILFDPLQSNPSDLDLIDLIETKQVFIEVKKYDKSSIASYNKFINEIFKKNNSLHVGFYLKTDCFIDVEKKAKKLFSTLLESNNLDTSKLSVRFVSHNQCESQHIAKNEITYMGIVNEYNIEQSIVANQQNFKVIGGKKHNYFDKANFINYDSLSDNYDLRTNFNKTNSQCLNCDFLPLCGGISWKEQMNEFTCPKIRINIKSRLRLRYEYGSD